MKLRQTILLAALGLALCSSVSGEKHVRRHRNREKTAETSHTQDPAVAAMLTAAEIEREAEKKYLERQSSRTMDLQEQIEGGTNEVFVDACSLVHCSAGRVCELDDAGDASCVCIKECPYETESRRQVCTNHNETWPSDCLMYQHRCQCMEGSEQCKGPEYHHVQIEYYGPCREMPECTESEMSDFPRRMRDWLFNVMRDLADRRELSPHYLKMQREAEKNLTRRWTNAAIWKWCDLDAHDNDRFVSRHELFPIRAPLMALEHCIAPFLNSCDTNDDHRITLAEWGNCLGLEEFDLEERCDDILEGTA